MILSSNQVYSVFSLISIFINSVNIFILFNVDFLGIILPLIYAYMILFSYILHTTLII